MTVRRAGGADRQQACARAGHGVRQARRYVHANLHDGDLSPDRVVESLGLSRPSVYRLFQHEGGLVPISGMCACAPPPTSSSHGPAFRCRTSPMLTASGARRISGGRFDVLTASRRRKSGTIATACAYRQNRCNRGSRLPDVTSCTDRVMRSFGGSEPLRTVPLGVTTLPVIHRLNSVLRSAQFDTSPI